MTINRIAVTTLCPRLILLWGSPVNEGERPECDELRACGSRTASMMGLG
jgi:hypothetical protein